MNKDIHCPHSAGANKPNHRQTDASHHQENVVFSAIQASKFQCPKGSSQC
jgi:hypothetical protein